jgi:hypothetical protein
LSVSPFLRACVWCIVYSAGVPEKSMSSSPSYSACSGSSCSKEGAILIVVLVGARRRDVGVYAGECGGGGGLVSSLLCSLAPTCWMCVTAMPNLPWGRVMPEAVRLRSREDGSHSHKQTSSQADESGLAESCRLFGPRMRRWKGGSAAVPDFPPPSLSPFDDDDRLHVQHLDHRNTC